MLLKKTLSLFVCLCALSLLSACTEARYAAHVVKQIPFPSDPDDSVGHFKVGNSYDIQGTRYQPQERYNHTETGMASWYGPGFHNKNTANGELFDENELTAAHRTLQLPSIIRVTNLANGRTVVLRVNDRGPFAKDRILDVSKRAASLLGFKSQGTTKIRLEVLEEASKEVADRAKAGQSTKGFELALNQQGSAHQAPVPPRPVTAPTSRIEPVTQVAMSPPYGANPYTTQQQPTPVRKPMPVQAEALNAPLPPTLGMGRIYVQAGSFSSEQNALSFSNQMARFGSSKVYLTRIDNKPFYRVRLGPYNDRAQAAQVIGDLVQSGNVNAVIVSE